jgi:putative hydrolase of the HAD superfamily
LIRIAGANISAVLFDLDNTLVDRDQAVRRLGRMLYLEAEVAATGVGEREFIERFVEIDAGGTIPDKRVQMSEVAKEFTLHDRSPDELLKWWNLEYPLAFSLDDSVSILLDMLAANGIPWGIVSNGSPLQLDVVRSTGLDQRADAVVVSSVVGIRKPQREIFVHAAELLPGTCGFDEILFVGDNCVADIEGASDAGMKTVWVSRGAEWCGSGRNVGETVERLGDLKGLIEWT